MNIFELYKNLTVDKNRLDDTEISESVNCVALNRLMSYDRLAGLYASVLNRNIFNIPKKTLYLFYLYGLEKRNKTSFLNLKKEKNEEENVLVEFAQSVYFKESSKVKIQKMLPMIKDDLKTKMKELTKGGLKR